MIIGGSINSQIHIIHMFMINLSFCHADCQPHNIAMMAYSVHRNIIACSFLGE